MSPERYDALVIGSGQAGDPLSHRLADHGWSVALVEKGPLGGTCINTGCTPTKTMVHRAQVAYYAREASRWGVEAGEVRADLAKIVAQKDAVVAEFRAGQEKQVEKRPNLRLHRGVARFTGPHEVEVDGRLLESGKIFIDTGARARIPPIPGLESVGPLTNETLLALTRLPGHLLVLGGGYVGLEFAQMFRRFGSRVTIIHNGSQLLGREDPEIASELQKALEAEGVAFRLNASTDRAEKKNGGIRIHLTGPNGSEEVEGTHLLVAAGRRPNTDDLRLDRAGVETDPLGFIRVNARLETNVPGIWALGDVKGGPAFTHISYNDFQIVYGNLVEGKRLSTAGRIVPYCVFTDPQLGGIGMTEREAREKGFQLKIGKVPVSRIARARERGETAGLLKIVVDAADDRVLGASLLCPEGGELVQILHTLMLAGKPYTLLKGAVYIHPTLAEGFFALMEDVKPAG
jgi:pyruvate/2-oxoglutarate dehydrogenase complex dihydrolipoamide dehydrogenase (E3) component